MDLDKSVYEFFNYCKMNGDRKAVIVVTDKQYVVYTETDPNATVTHNSMTLFIENMIHPNKEMGYFDDYNSNNAYIYSSGNDLVVTLPEDGNLSPNQAIFLTDIINQTCDFNEVNNDLISIVVFYKSEVKEWKGHDREAINNSIVSKVTDKYKVDDELIIGNIISDGIIINPKKENLGKSR